MQDSRYPYFQPTPTLVQLLAGAFLKATGQELLNRLAVAAVDEWFQPPRPPANTNAVAERRARTRSGRNRLGFLGSAWLLLLPR